METLPKDVVEFITKKLLPREFISFCSSGVGDKACSNADVWRRRLEKDFGNLLREYPDAKILEGYTENPRQVYLAIFEKTSKAVEEIEKIFLPFLRDVKKYEIYDFFFRILIDGILQREDNAIVYINRVHNHIWNTRVEWPIDRLKKSPYMKRFWISNLGRIFLDYYRTVTFNFFLSPDMLTVHL